MIRKYVHIPIPKTAEQLIEMIAASERDVLRWEASAKRMQRAADRERKELEQLRTRLRLKRVA